VKVSRAAPEFKVQKSADMSDYVGERRRENPDHRHGAFLDTPVCDIEGKRFNDEASKLPNVEVVIVSMDRRLALVALPADKIITASDHRGRLQQNGLLISGGPLDQVLARAVFVVGADNKQHTWNTSAASASIELRCGFGNSQVTRQAEIFR
jgi:thiol peroxidase